MNPELSHAERVRRWFSAEVRPEPPTDEELMALASGRHEVIDAEAVAEALALDPGSQRRYEEVLRFLERPSASPAEVPEEAAAAVKGLVERAAEWLMAKGAVLAAKVQKTGEQLKAAGEVGGSWDEVVMVRPQTLTMRGFAPSHAGHGGSDIVQLKDGKGRRVQVAGGATGYKIEFDLSDPRLTGFLNVQRVPLYGVEEMPFERDVMLEGGRGMLDECPPGLIHIQLGDDFEMYLLLEDCSPGVADPKDSGRT
jgi:hypothetical protein